MFSWEGERAGQLAHEPGSSECCSVSGMTGCDLTEGASTGGSIDMGNIAAAAFADGGGICLTGEFDKA